MLAHLRNSALRSLRPCSTATSSRFLSLSAVRRRESEEAYESHERGEPRSRERSGNAGYAPDEKGYVAWLQSEGAQYKTTHRPRNWLGGNKTPFPLNPTFKPPTPVGDDTKQLIYDQFMSNPAENHVRALAALHGLSIARVDAILRLKGLEEHWKKGKQLQTGFQYGMETILGVQDNKKAGSGASASLSEDTVHADLQSDAEANDKARNRYHRLFWEPVPEGKEPIIPEALEKTQGHKERKTMPVRVVERGDRPDFHFVDVGNSFVDPKVEKDRAKRAAHRADLRRKHHQTDTTPAPEATTTEATITKIDV